MIDFVQFLLVRVIQKITFYYVSIQQRTSYRYTLLTNSDRYCKVYSQTSLTEYITNQPLTVKRRIRYIHYQLYRVTICGLYQLSTGESIFLKTDFAFPYNCSTNYNMQVPEDVVLKFTCKEISPVSGNSETGLRGNGMILIRISINYNLWIPKLSR